MNRKVIVTGALALILVAAGCSQKPTAAPSADQDQVKQGAAVQAESETSAADASGESTASVPEPAEASASTSAAADSPDTTSGNAAGKSTGEDTAGQSSTSGQAAAPTDSSKASQTASADEESKQKIAVYYTDPQEMELKKAEAEISFPTKLQKYKAAFQALQHSDNSDLVPLWSDTIELKQLEFVNGALTLNISLPDTARLGSGGEQFALDALKQTMFQFSEVKSIELLVNGDKVESLMGHVDLDHPMTR
ncbi:GerMN domain-containing protein [Paenibacillus sp. JX-17]|uniref:GerMN domain-containing protein n=1 Tax=Paenibacillus lacisoli TaxID=3064525 RepID=A0ABT9CBL6_9BACL|nr:GerMN domain-containing protein [Paenibacillus sp. JX-17]MDO7905008.1 GerMN domain-containing protein [Paenibacillus sp. JX-17]